jgi:CRP/FNR family nitrogen fixation transcriptional regulator
MLQTAPQNIPLQAPPASFAAGNAYARKVAAPVRAYETRLRINAGETIFREGDEALYFYKVVTGSVRLVKSVADGHRQICDFNLAGDLLGYSNAAQHEFTAQTIQDCTLIRYRRKDTISLIRSDAAFACELQSLTARGLSSAYAHMIRLCHRSAHDRLAWFLLSMAERAENADGWIELPMTRVDIADYLGLAHETVSRIFTRLKKSRAIIEPTLNRIKIVNRQELENKLDAA